MVLMTRMVCSRVGPAAGLPRQRFHDLRHTCASLLLAQGVHLRAVMETLGYSQIKLTVDTYSHVIPQLQREAAGRINEILAARGIVKESSVLRRPAG